jgi:hypothetical protein
MRKLRFIYYLLFVSLYDFSRKVKADGKPEEVAYWLICYSNMINFATILLVIKVFTRIDLEIGAFLYALIVVVPFFIINHFLFLKRKKYVNIILELKSSMNYLYGLFYMIFSILFFVIVAYNNMP